jgi:hypothetical protein
MRYRIPLLVAVLVLAPAAAEAYVGNDDPSDPIYFWSDTLHPRDADVPTYDFTSIARTGTSIELWMGSAGPFPIGFSFEFYEESYDEFYANNMGLLSFGAAAGGGGPTRIPSAGAPNGFVAGLWSIYDSWEGMGIAYYQTRGTAPNRQLVVEWSLTTEDWSTATFQVVLDEASGDIFVYVQTGGSSWSTSTVGIENQDGTRGIQAYSSSGRLDRYAAVFSSSSERPRIRVLTSDLTVPEGGSISLEVDVTDAQDDLLSVTWDIDGDGEFDDGEGETVDVPATHTNGPGTLSPTVRAEDEAGNVKETVINIEVTNEPPVFRNDPVTEVLRRQEWTYEPAILDPGGDEFRVTAETRPEGMTVLAGGGLRWTPGDDDVGEHPIRLVATDADDDPEVEGDGDAVLEFTLTVLDNTAPGQPFIIRPRNGEVVDTLRPTFVVETPVDPEGDQLMITFDIDTSDTFASPDHLTSGPIRASLGQTGWTVMDDLVDGESYWWRVYASDGIDQGPAARARFTVDLASGDDGGPDGGEPDAGLDGGPDDAEVGGCTCRTVPVSGRPAVVLVLLSGLAALVLRRHGV